MTTEELVYDILEVKSLLTDDVDIDELWILNKINMYRHVFIDIEYANTHVIRPSWLLRFPKTKVEKVTSADDPAIIFTSINVGKTIIPKVIGLPEDLGLYRISGSSGISQFQPIDFNTLMMKIDAEEEKQGDYGYCSRIGNILYLWPLVLEIQGIIIPEDPFAIQVNDAGVLRDRLVSDDYPLDMDMAQRIVLEILTKDLNINDQQIGDIVNDSQSQLKILKNTNQQVNGSSQQQTANG
jgi:hypothetical protein